MNILTVSAQKPDSTGSGVYLAETVSGFASQGHRVTVVCGVDALDDPGVPGASDLYACLLYTSTTWGSFGLGSAAARRAIRWKTPSNGAPFRTTA